MKNQKLIQMWKIFIFTEARIFNQVEITKWCFKTHLRANIRGPKHKSVANVHHCEHSSAFNACGPNSDTCVSRKRESRFAACSNALTAELCSQWWTFVICLGAQSGPDPIAKPQIRNFSYLGHVGNKLGRLWATKLKIRDPGWIVLFCSASALAFSLGGILIEFLARLRLPSEHLSSNREKTFSNLPHLNYFCSFFLLQNSSVR